MGTASIAAPVVRAERRTARPSFVGMVRGELFKVSRQRATWILALVLGAIICLPFLVVLTGQGFKNGLQAAPLDELYRTMGRNLLVLRVFSGTFLILLTARLIGMEYSSGTIRVLLGRGVGRLQLLGAKLAAIALIALGVLVAGLALETLLTVVTVQMAAGNLNALKSLDGAFWNDTWLYVVTILINMAATILMATAVTVIGRSLAVGLSVGVSFFAVDNIGVIFFYLAYRLTNSTFWTQATGDLLGPNLNAMAGAILPGSASFATFRAMTPPLVPVDGGHTLLVTAIWSAAFLVTAVMLTWKRDVTE